MYQSVVGSLKLPCLPTLQSSSGCSWQGEKYDYIVRKELLTCNNAANVIKLLICNIRLLVCPSFTPTLQPPTLTWKAYSGLIANCRHKQTTMPSFSPCIPMQTTALIQMLAHKLLWVCSLTAVCPKGLCCTVSLSLHAGLAVKRI